MRAVADDGIEAHLVHVPARRFRASRRSPSSSRPPASANVLAMQAAASATRHGAVTVANREALTSGGYCRPGDILGVVDGDVVIVGSDQARRRPARSCGASSRVAASCVTVVSGIDAPDGLVAAVADEARRDQHGLEVSLIDGGQPVYPVLLGVE